MKTPKIFSAAALLVSLVSGAQVWAGAATAANYRSIIQGINGKFDRDWQSLNPSGKPDPGALGTLETMFGAFNTLGITGPTTVSSFFDQNTATCAGPASGTCNGIKVNLTNSTHSLTLFGAATTFSYDLVVWMDSGSGYQRFIEGSFSPPSGGNSGKGNIMFTSCGGCTPVSHSNIEWDTTSTTYHLKTSMYDTKMGGGAAHGNVMLDVQFVPSTGDLKAAAAATNACSASTADSICNSGGGTANTEGYTAMIHANMNSGLAFIVGAGRANASGTVPASGADNICIKADHTSDGTAGPCTAVGIDNFTGITAIPPSTPNALSWGAGVWPFVEITDTPNF